VATAGERAGHRLPGWADRRSDPARGRGAADRARTAERGDRGSGEASTGQEVAEGAAPGGLRRSVRAAERAGGDCLDDFDGLRRDRGLAALLGYDLPAASTARQWLDCFHDPAAVADRPRQGSLIPPESAGLAGLRAVIQQSVRTYVAAVRPGPAVKLDVDAHLVEASQRSALPTYEGFRGYQPLLVEWAESGLVLADEFRDGNVPAWQKIRELVDEAVASLPPRADGDPWQVSVRSDSAAYDQQVLDHWAKRGWRFAVSAEMSRQLRDEILALPCDAWQFRAAEAKGFVREWADVPSCRAGPASGATPNPTATWRSASAACRGCCSATGPRSSTSRSSPTTGTPRGGRCWSGSGARPGS
jgi:hypothetical protein